MPVNESIVSLTVNILLLILLRWLDLSDSLCPHRHHRSCPSSINPHPHRDWSVPTHPPTFPLSAFLSTSSTATWTIFSTWNDRAAWIHKNSQHLSFSLDKDSAPYFSPQSPSAGPYSSHRPRFTPIPTPPTSSPTGPSWNMSFLLTVPRVPLH